MCGIVASFGRDTCETAWIQYKSQKSRGQEGYGYLAFKGGKIIDFQRATGEREIRKALQKIEPEKPDAVIFHHRFPTSTINVKEAAHPIPLEKKGWKHTYYIVHNGVVSGVDDDECKGYSFSSRVSEVKMYRAGSELYEVQEGTSVNDSEILGYCIAEYLEGNAKDIPMSGSIAALMVQVNEKGHAKVFAMRNYGNPLTVKRKKNRMTIASEGSGDPMPAHFVYRLDWSTLKWIEHAKLNIGASYPTTPEYYKGIYGGESVTNVPSRTMGFHESEKAVIDSEVTKARIEADKTYSDYQEALKTIQEYSERGMSPDEIMAMSQYAGELRDRWYDAEEAYGTLCDDNGIDYARYPEEFEGAITS